MTYYINIFVYFYFNKIRKLIYLCFNLIGKKLFLLFLYHILKKNSKIIIINFIINKLLEAKPVSEKNISKLL